MIIFQALKILLIILTLTLPLANSDLFAVFTPKLYIPNFILIFVLLFFGLNLFFSKKTEVIIFMKALAKDWPFRLLIFIFLARVISLINSENLVQSAFLLVFFLAMIGLYAVFFYLSQKESNLLGKVFRKIYIPIACLTGFYGLAQILLLFLGKKLPGVLVGNSFLRVPATFYDVNHLPPFLLSVLPLTLSLAWLQKKTYLRYFYYFVSLILTLILFFTFSRSGILAFAVAIFFFVAYLVRFKYYQKVSLFVGLFTFLVILFVLSSRTNVSFVKRIVSVINPMERSTSAHGLLLSGEWYLFTKNPIIGVGYGSFNEHFRNTPIGLAHAKIDPALNVRLPTHSIWLEALCETGLLGFLPYLGFMLYLIHTLSKSVEAAKNNYDRLFSAGISSSVIGIIIGGIFYSYNLIYFWYFLFFGIFFARLILKDQEEVRKEEFAPEKINFREILPPVVVFAFSLLIIFSGLGVANLSGKEAFLAVLSKSVLRDWERNWAHWWIPIYRGADYKMGVGLNQIYVWLSSLAMFFYQINSVTPRFWSAFFGATSTLTFYLVLKRFFNIRFALLLSVIFLSCPLFLKYTKLGLPYSLLIFGLLLVAFAATFFLAKNIKLRQINFPRFYIITVWLLPILSLVLLRSFIFPKNVLKHEVYLAQVRYKINNNGNVPSIILMSPSDTLDYHGEVPFKYIEEKWLREEILKYPKGCFVFLEVRKYGTLKASLSSDKVGLRVVASSDDLLLIERI